MADLPRGTVAFLFTDVEGSTRRWERDPGAMRAVVERHVALLREAIKAQRGVIFKSIGDAVQAAFPTVPDAASAALTGQRALTAEPPWGNGDFLTVRMAIHAGEAAPDPRGDYLAPCLNRLARLLGAGHGGQVPLSAVAAGLARHALPPDAALRELGIYRLRDLLDAEPVWQLVAPDLRSDFPPLATLERHRTNLPVQPTPLIGRDAEVARLRNLLVDGGPRLVTLTSPGGTGKTRLALQAAAEVLEAFPDGVWFVDLAPVRDPRPVLSAVAAAVGVREPADRPLIEELRAFLGSRRLLLVTDNVEQVADAAGISRISSRWRRGSWCWPPAGHRFWVRAEQEFPVGPLPMPVAGAPVAEVTASPAVALFLERTRAAGAEVAPTDANAATLAEIVRRLDGLPLAIELAAVRIRVFPPEALLERLERRLPLLSGGARDLPERQRTLAGTIAWSHDLLAPAERVLFRRLSVFAGGCSFEAAKAVATRDGEVDPYEGWTPWCARACCGKNARRANRASRCSRPSASSPTVSSSAPVAARRS